MTTKTYAAESLYSIQEVSVVFPTLRTRSEKKKNYQSTQNAYTPPEKSFSEALKEAKEKEQPRNIHVYTSGYTKNALPFQNLVSQREYN